MKTVTINVLQDDINKGWANNPGACPIALAAARTLRVPCTVGDETLSVDNYRSFATLPLSAQAFVLTFDLGGSVSPFSFDVEVLE